MANPDLPDRALPAAWRLLMAAYSGGPCRLDDAGDCQAHRWPGPHAIELRRDLGVHCLNVVVPRVVEAESEGEVAFRIAQLMPNAASEPPDEPPLAEQLTVGDLWRAMEKRSVAASMLRTALAKTIELMNRRDVEALEWKSYIEQAAIWLGDA